MIMNREKEKKKEKERKRKKKQLQQSRQYVDNMKNMKINQQ